MTEVDAKCAATMAKWDAFYENLKPGLQARWGALCEFGVGDLRPGDGSRIVEPWALRTARMWALNLGCWGLGTELAIRRRLRLWITPVDNPSKQPIHRRASHNKNS